MWLRALRLFMERDKQVVRDHYTVAVCQVMPPVCVEVATSRERHEVMSADPIYGHTHQVCRFPTSYQLGWEIVISGCYRIVPVLSVKHLVTSMPTLEVCLFPGTTRAGPTETPTLRIPRVRRRPGEGAPPMRNTPADLGTVTSNSRR